MVLECWKPRSTPVHRVVDGCSTAEPRGERAMRLFQVLFIEKRRKVDIRKPTSEARRQTTVFVLLEHLLRRIPARGWPVQKKKKVFTIPKDPRILRILGPCRGSERDSHAG